MSESEYRPPYHQDGDREIPDLKQAVSNVENNIAEEEANIQAASEILEEQPELKQDFFDSLKKAVLKNKGDLTAVQKLVRLGAVLSITFGGVYATDRASSGEISENAKSLAAAAIELGKDMTNPNAMNEFHDSDVRDQRAFIELMGEEDVSTEQWLIQILHDEYKQQNLSSKEAENKISQALTDETIVQLIAEDKGHLDIIDELRDKGYIELRYPEGSSLY